MLPASLFPFHPLLFLVSDWYTSNQTQQKRNRKHPNFILKL